jgi:hypothetical protein
MLCLCVLMTCGLLGLGPLAVVAQQSNLNEFCNGEGPEAITSALPSFDPPLSAEVPQLCIDVAGVSRCFYGKSSSEWSSCKG